jgi:hypothetical protein
MNASLRAPPDDVPTLTEVVRPSELVVTREASAASVESSIDEERLTLQIVDDVQARVDALLEAGLRERLPAVLNQLAEGLLEGLIREFRAEFAPGLVDAVRQAVAHELSRSRSG